MKPVKMREGWRKKVKMKEGLCHKREKGGNGEKKERKHEEEERDN